jgi:uncharacterized membrane protein
MVLSLRRDRIARLAAEREVVVVAASLVFVGCWLVLDTWFWAHHRLIDTPVYQGYGLAIRNGLMPYRDIPVEYPPGALAAFVAPTFVGSYASTFAWLMAACGVGCIVVAAAAGARTWALAYIAVSPLLVGALVKSRFDLWPELFVLAALAALLHERQRLGWAALGAAVATKLYALVLVPLALVWTFRRRGAAELARSIACGVAVLAATVLPFAILAPSGLWSSVRGEASRPLQIESLGASFLTTFAKVDVIATHGSLNLAHEGGVAAASTVLEAAVLIALWIAFALGPMDEARLVRYCAASLCAFVALGKVLSPQFLIWLVPIVPLVRGRRGMAASALLAVAFVLTQVFFPARYWQYVFHQQLAGVVLARNLVLVVLLATLSLPARARGRARSA